MVTSYEGLFFSGDFTTQQVQQDRDEQNGWHSFKGHLPHQQREDRGCELLHKGNEEKCLLLPGLRLFRLSDLIETHKDSLYGKPTDGSSGRHYSRKNPYNQKRLKQTIFRLPDDGNKKAVWPPDYTPKDLDPKIWPLECNKGAKMNNTLLKNSIWINQSERFRNTVRNRLWKLQSPSWIYFKFNNRRNFWVLDHK